MIGIGPYLPHPATPLGEEFGRRRAAGDWPADQAPNDELTTCKVLALTRLVRPDANLPGDHRAVARRQGRRACARPAARRERRDAEPDAAGVPREVRDLPGEGRRARDRRGDRREHRRACSRRSGRTRRPAPAGPGGERQARNGAAPSVGTRGRESDARPRRQRRLELASSSASSTRTAVSSSRRDLPAPRGPEDAGADHRRPRRTCAGVDAVGHRVVHGGAEFAGPV